MKSSIWSWSSFYNMRIIYISYLIVTNAWSTYFSIPSKNIHTWFIQIIYVIISCMPENVKQIIIWYHTCSNTYSVVITILLSINSNVNDWTVKSYFCILTIKKRFCNLSVTIISNSCLRYSSFCNIYIHIAKTSNNQCK